MPGTKTGLFTGVTVQMMAVYLQRVVALAIIGVN